MSMNYQDFVLDLLSLLANKGPIAGKDIIKELGKEHPLYASRSNIYVWLGRLEDEGLIVSNYESPPDPGKPDEPRRLLYDISEKGKGKRIELTSESQSRESGDGLEAGGGDPATARVIANRRQPVGVRDR